MGYNSFMHYTVIYINDRSKKNIENIKNKLSYLEYAKDINFCDGRRIDARKIIEDMGFSINWKPYDGRTTDPLPTEFGTWVSNINVYKYIVKNKIQEMLVLEDDAILSKDFLNIINKIMSDSPKLFDFISLYSFEDQNYENKTTDIENLYLHKSINQYSAFQGMIFSYSGAKKILRLLKKEGIEYTNDCQIFRKSLEEKLNGYSLKKEYKIIEHDLSVKSNIEEGNHRYS
jgi:GR25 family glycosyltransferase involved in LPS biosynthesis